MARFPVGKERRSKHVAAVQPCGAKFRNNAGDPLETCTYAKGHVSKWHGNRTTRQRLGTRTHG